MRFAARSLVAAALTVLVLAGCECAAHSDGAHSDGAHSDGAHAHGAVAEARAALAAAQASESPAPQSAVETDPHFDTCADAAAAGYGPYVQGVDPEYDWYRDSDHDGTTCEK